MADIVRYEVRLETVSDPIHGRSKVLVAEDDIKNGEDAVAQAKAIADRRQTDKVYVVENHYTSQANVERHFTLQSVWYWSAAW